MLQSPALRKRFAASLIVWSLFAFSIAKLLGPASVYWLITFSLYIVMSIGFMGYFWLQYRYTLSFKEFILSVIFYNVIFNTLLFIYNSLLLLHGHFKWEPVFAFVVADLLIASMFYAIFKVIKASIHAK